MYYYNYLFICNNLEENRKKLIPGAADRARPIGAVKCFILDHTLCLVYNYGYRLASIS